MGEFIGSRVVERTPQEENIYESQRLKQLSQSLYVSDLGPLHICYCCIAWCTFGTPSSGSRGCFWCLCLLLVPFSSTWLPYLSLIWQYVCAFYCILLCHLWLISLGGLVLSEGKQKNAFWGKVRWEQGSWKKWREGKLWSGCNIWAKNFKNIQNTTFSHLSQFSWLQLALHNRRYWYISQRKC